MVRKPVPKQIETFIYFRCLNGHRGAEIGEIINVSQLIYVIYACYFWYIMIDRFPTRPFLIIYP